MARNILMISGLFGVQMRLALFHERRKIEFAID